MTFFRPAPSRRRPDPARSLPAQAGCRPPHFMAPATVERQLQLPFAFCLWPCAAQFWLLPLLLPLLSCPCSLAC